VDEYKQGCEFYLHHRDGEFNSHRAFYETIFENEEFEKQADQTHLLLALKSFNEEIQLFGDFSILDSCPLRLGDEGVEYNGSVKYETCGRKSNCLSEDKMSDVMCKKWNEKV
jgi:hypothetical protein